MGHPRKISTWLWPICLSLILFSCAREPIFNSWKNHEFSGKAQKIYLVGISKDDEIRQKYEGQFQKALASYNVDGIPSYPDFSIGHYTKKDDILENLVKHDVDALALTRVLSKKEIKLGYPYRPSDGSSNAMTDYSYSESYEIYGDGIASPPYSLEMRNKDIKPPPYFNSFGTYFDQIYQRRVSSEAYSVPFSNWEAREAAYEEHEIVILEVNLYDRQSENLIWSTLVQTTVQANIDLLLKNVIDKVVVQMNKDGLI
jgi:hypothetical protein